MYDVEKVISINKSITAVRNTLNNVMSDTVRRLAVTRLREIATELDCLKPVDAIEGELTRVEMNPAVYPASLPSDFVTAQNMHNFNTPDPIPAAPGPDYATQKQLDAAVGTLNSTAMVDRNAVLALTDRVELIEKALNCRSGKVLSSYQDVVNEGRLDRLEKDVMGIEKALAAVEPDNEVELQAWERQRLYNQAYLAALPAMIKQWGVDGAAGATDRIATQSMEYLK